MNIFIFRLTYCINVFTSNFVPSQVPRLGYHSIWEAYSYTIFGGLRKIREQILSDGSVELRNIVLSCFGSSECMPYLDLVLVLCYQWCNHLCRSLLDKAVSGASTDGGCQWHSNTSSFSQLPASTCFICRVAR